MSPADLKALALEEAAAFEARETRGRDLMRPDHLHLQSSEPAEKARVHDNLVRGAMDITKLEGATDVYEGFRARSEAVELACRLLYGVKETPAGRASRLSIVAAQRAAEAEALEAAAAKKAKKKPVAPVEGEEGEATAGAGGDGAGEGEGEGGDEDNKEGSGGDEDLENAALSEMQEEEVIMEVEPPVDEDGVPCMTKLCIPLDVVTHMLARLRHRTVQEMTDRAETRHLSVSALCEKRNNDLTFELEERLRLHWPRKGFTETQFQAPRLGELLAHRKKIERHVRTIMQRNRLHAKTFHGLVADADGAVGQYKEHIAALGEVLEEQSSLAALQGILQRAKHATAEFKADGSDRIHGLDPSMFRDPQGLVQSNAKVRALYTYSIQFRRNRRSCVHWNLPEYTCMNILRRPAAT